MSHSKRNTSRPVFTSHERAIAKSNWGSNTARLHRESFLPFGSCGLCLEIARDPIACQRGDLFCRECALANLLAQKKELKRAARVRQDAEHELAEIKAMEDEEERERAIRDFEMTEAGFSIADSRPAAASSAAAGQLDSASSAGSKRKFTLDEDELVRIATEDKAKARKALDNDKASKPALPSFWTPSLTPDAHESRLSSATKKGKTVPTCPASSDDSPHALSLQKLISLHFEEDKDPSARNQRRICPSCRKVLSNSAAPVAVRQCGHVFCRNCVKQFLTNPKQAEPQGPLTCLACDTLISPKKASDATDNALPPGLVPLRSEGTGFAARGASKVEKSHVAFQC